MVTYHANADESIDRSCFHQHPGGMHWGFHSVASGMTIRGLSRLLRIEYDLNESYVMWCDVMRCDAVGVAMIL
jgi:hypothetical protein